VSAESQRENAARLRRRVIDEAGLGLPVPLVSTAIAELLVDLVVALEGTVLEYGIVEAFAAREQPAGLPRVVAVDVERERPA